MDTHSSLHSLVLFANNVEEASSFYSQLISAPLSLTGDLFAEIETELCDLGFHPADEKGNAGLVVSYWRVRSIEDAMIAAQDHGFTLYRGPLRVRSITVAQLRDAAGMVIGLVERHEGSHAGPNE